MADLKLAGALASLILGATALATPACAQFYERPWGGYRYNAPPPAYPYGAPGYRDERPLPPFEFVERLEARGFVAVSRPRYDGSVYVVDATSPRGRRIRLVFDAFRGGIVDRYALDGGRFRDEENGLAPRRYADRPEMRAPSDDVDEAPLGNRRALGPEPERRAPGPNGRVQGLNPEAAHPEEPRSERKTRAERPAPHREAHRGPSGKVKAIPPTRPDAATGEAGTEPDAAKGEAVTTAPSKPASAGKAAISPKAPAPALEAAKPTSKPSARKAAETAEAGREGKTVRVIPGVTPMNVGPQPDSAAALGDLPTPPAVTPPTDLK